MHYWRPEWNSAIMWNIFTQYKFKKCFKLLQEMFEIFFSCQSKLDNNAFILAMMIRLHEGKTVYLQTNVSTWVHGSPHLGQQSWLEPPFLSPPPPPLPLLAGPPPFWSLPLPTPLLPPDELPRLLLLTWW